MGHTRVGTAHVRGLSGSQARASRISHGRLGNTSARNLSSARLGAHASVARGNAARAVATGAAGALAGKAAWNHWGNPNWHGGWGGWNGGWGGWNGGWGGWVGPVFWPYFFGNLLAFTFWPYPYFDPFWAYGDWFVWDAVFWPGPYYGPAFANGPNYYDIYGYSSAGRTRIARPLAPEVTGSTLNQTDLAQSCGGLAPGVTDLPLDRIETTLQLSSEQLKALNDLKAATSQASDILKTSCSSGVPLTPVDRLGAVQKRINSMREALEIVRTPLDNFYNSLNEGQRQRFAALSPARAEQTRRRSSVSATDLASLCSRGAEGFTQLPVQRIEQVIKPTQQQLDVFDKLKAASTEAANQLHASCPTQLPQTPLDRFDAVSKRLDAMSEAIKTVRPALTDFYASLSDEQKARFNMLGPPNASRQG
jgi:LTXXQ motif family protein